jgi:MFS family permease
MIALNISAGLSGYALGRMVHYKLLPLMTLLVAIAAIATLAWRVDSLDIVSFELLLTLIGLGFGPLPGLTQVSLQNSVERHQLGIAVGTMTFVRNLFATMLIAVFGAIVAGAVATEPAAGPLGGLLQPDAAMAAAAFRRVFFTAAVTLSCAFVAILLLEQKPLQSGEQETK